MKRFILGLITVMSLAGMVGISEASPLLQGLTKQDNVIARHGRDIYYRSGTYYNYPDYYHYSPGTYYYYSDPYYYDSMTWVPYRHHHHHHWQH